MKRIILCALTILVLFTVSRARAQDYTKPLVPYSTYPIGAFRWSDSVAVKLLGMNCGFWFWQDKTPAIPQSGGVYDSGVTLRDPFYFDTNTTHTMTGTSRSFDGPWWNILWQGSYGNDVRAFLPGTSGATQEYSYGWNFKKGDNYPSNLNEWIIATDSVNSGDLVLSDLGEAKTTPYEAEGFGLGDREHKHEGTYSYEFVHYFDAFDLTAVGPDDRLYRLEIWREKAGVPDSLLDSLTITRSLYNSFPEAITQPAGLTAAGKPRSVESEILSIWDNQRAHHYKLLKRILNIRAIWGGDGSAHPGFDKIDVRLRTFKQIPIFPRLLRIRDWRAQRLLSGAADSLLGVAIKALKNVGRNSSAAAWFTSNEANPKSFHAWAYMNELLTRYGAPPAACLGLLSTAALFARVRASQAEYNRPD